MPADYLNPIELLDLTGPEPPERPSLRKAYKRFLTVLELDGKAEFDFKGTTFTRHDLDQTLEACKSEEWLVAYCYTANNPGLSTFLATGKFNERFLPADVNNVRFTPLLKPYFAPAFDGALIAAMKAGRYDVAVDLLDSVNFTQLPLADRHLFGRTHDVLTNRVRKYLQLVERAGDARSVLFGEGRKIKTLLDVYRTNFPREILTRLPHYFSGLFNDLARHLLRITVLTCTTGTMNTRWCTTSAKNYSPFHHINPYMRSELMRISNQAADATWRAEA